MHGVVAIFLAETSDTFMQSIEDRGTRLFKRGWQRHDFGDHNLCATKGEAQCLVYDGFFFAGLVWINNRAEVRQALDLEPNGTETDLALMALLWVQKGPAFEAEVSGAFSLIVFDPDRNEVHVFRDHFGMMPLYYCSHAGQFTCGTDLRAILHLSNHPMKPDKTRLANFVLGEEVDRDRTAFADLKRLPAAHYLAFERVHPVSLHGPQRYWTLPQPPKIALNDAPAGLRAQLEKACLASADRSGRLGTMLSGGLDSSSLTALIAGVLRDRNAPPLPTLSFAYPGKPYDETTYFSEFDQGFHTDQKQIMVTDTPDLSQLRVIVDEQMDVFLGYGLQKSRAIYHAGHDMGLAYLVDGHGGDEVISHGYGRLVELAASRRWIELYSATRGATNVHGTSFAAVYLTLLARFSGLKQRNILRRLLLRLARDLQRSRTKSGAAFDCASLLLEEAKSTTSQNSETRTSAGPDADPLAQDPKRRETFEHRQMLEAPLMEHAFEVLHRTACAAGILPVYPFYDKHLVEFCLSVPSEAKLRDGTTRWVLREGLKGLLPEKIRTRTTKAEFGDEFAGSVRTHAATSGVPFYEGAEAFIDVEAAKRLHKSIVEASDFDIDKTRAYWRVLVLREWLGALQEWRRLQAAGELI